MYKILLALLLLSSGTSAQVLTKPNNSYGIRYNRMLSDSAQFITQRWDTAKSTIDTFPQFFYRRADSSFWGWSSSRKFFKVGGSSISDGNNYVTGGAFASNTLTLNRHLLTDLQIGIPLKDSSDVLRALANTKVDSIRVVGDTLYSRNVYGWKGLLIPGSAKDVTGFEITRNGLDLTAFLGLKDGTAYIRTWRDSVGLTGNQTITLTGDVTGSGTTSIPSTVNWINGYPTYDGRYLQSLSGAILNQTTQQANSNFNISGDGTASRLRANGTILSTAPATVNSTSAGGFGFGGGYTSFYSFGANASTAGGYTFQNLSSDASVNLTPLSILPNGSLKFGQYGLGTITGTPSYSLATDASGNIIETPTAASLIANETLQTVSDRGASSTNQIFLNKTYGSVGTSVAGLKLGLNSSVGGMYIYGYDADGGILHNSEFISGGSWVARHTYANSMISDGSGWAWRTNDGLTANATFTPIDRMRLTMAGNLGIGTTDPRYKFHTFLGTNMNIHFRPIGDQSVIQAANDADNASTKLAFLGQEIIFNRDGAESMKINSSGAIKANSYGLGTITGTPAYNLAVDASGNVIETELPPTYSGANFILNQTTQQASSSFNISENGIIGGHLSVGNTITAASLASGGGYKMVVSNEGGTLSTQAISSGVTTMSAIGSSSNANGATISGNTLTMQPASSSFGGVITTGSQTFAGNKTFSGDMVINQSGGNRSINITGTNNIAGLGLFSTISAIGGVGSSAWAIQLYPTFPANANDQEFFGLYIQPTTQPSTYTGIKTTAIQTTTGGVHFVSDASGGNLTLGKGNESDGGGDVTFYMRNAATVPSSNPTNGGVLYVEGGALKYRSAGGTVTTIANN